MDIDSAQQLAQEAGLSLVRSQEGLALSDGVMSIRGDLARMLPRLKPGVLQREMLVKAARVKGVDAPLAVDATAGLGDDSLLLAAAGFRVLLFERNPVIAALLADALERAAGHPELVGIVARMQLVNDDSVARLPNLE